MSLTARLIEAASRVAATAQSEIDALENSITPGEYLGIDALTALSDRLRYDDLFIVRRDGTDYKATGEQIESINARWFNPSKYLNTADYEAALNYDTATQDEAAVTAAFRTMHDAMMTWVTGGNRRCAVVQYGMAEYAVNDELFSSSFVTNMWTQTNLGAEKAFGFFGVGDRLTRFKYTGTLSPVITRGAGEGPYASVSGPRALFPIFQQAVYRCSVTLQDIEIVGLFDQTKDMMGIISWNGLDMYPRNVNCDQISNVGIWFEGTFNSVVQNSTWQTVGCQPVRGGVLNGARSGFGSHTVKFTVTDLGGDSIQIDSTESYFETAHATNSERFYLQNGRYVSGTAQPLVCTITSRSSATRAIASVDTGTTVLAGSGLAGSFGIMTCSTTASSTTVTVDYPFDLGTDAEMLGRSLMLVGAGSTVHPDFDTLVTRLAGISVDRLTLTLAHPARETATNIPLVVSPSMYVGVSEDNDAGEANYPNDLRFFGCRWEYSHGYTGGQTSAVMIVAQGLRICQFTTCKTHGASMNRGNFGAGAINAIFDDCQSSIKQHQWTWGNWNENGNIWVTGLRTRLKVEDAQYGHWRPHNHESMWYINPQTSEEKHTKIATWGGMEADNRAIFPTGVQKFYNLGANGRDRMIEALGPIMSQQETMRELAPPIRTRIEAETATSSNTTIGRPVLVDNRCIGNTAIGFGVGYGFKLETSANNIESVAFIDAILTDTTPGSEDIDIVLKAMTGGAAPTEAGRFNRTAATLPGDLTLSGSGILRLSNLGLRTLDSDSSHYLVWSTGSNFTASRTFNLLMGDNNRTLDITANNVVISSNGAQLVSANTTAAATKILDAPWCQTIGPKPDAGATTAEVTAHSSVIPSSRLGSNGCIIIDLSMITNSTADDKTLRYKLNGNTIGTLLVTTSTGYNDHRVVWWNNSANSQRTFVGASPLGAHSSSYGTTTENQNANITFSITTQKEASGDTLSIAGGLISVVYGV